MSAEAFGGPGGDSFSFDEQGLLRCCAFDAHRGQRHGWGTRNAAPSVDVTLRQIHSDLVWDASGLKDREREGDALISNQPGRSIGVRTADCVPILFFDPRTGSVAATHAGWRGTASRIAEKTVEALELVWGVQRADLLAAIGPCIRACCYEVGAEVARRFDAFFPEWTPAMKAAPKQQLDLPEANRRQLLQAEIDPAHLFDSGLCTFCDAQHFYSYRRDPADPGRLLSAISAQAG